MSTKKLTLLFFYPSQPKEVSASRVHITEVLNNITLNGHTVIYANGKRHQVQELNKMITNNQLNLNHRNYHKTNKILRIPLLWVKKVLLKYLYGEMAIASYIYTEIKLFVLSLVTVIKHRPDLIYRRHSALAGEILLARIFDIPVINEVNGIIIDEIRISNRADGLSRKIINYLETQKFQKADRYIVVTSKMRDVLKKDYFVPKSKITFVENGANTSLFKPSNKTVAKNQLGLCESNNYLCFIGTLSRYQGIDIFIKALPVILREGKNTVALIVGDGEIKDEINKLITQLELTNYVELSGKVPYTQVPLFINASEICVAPFIGERNQRIGLSPLKIYEYLACGKPVVASKIKGIEMLEQINAGNLVPPGDIQEFSNTILNLLKNPDLCKAMGENGRNWVVKNHSWEVVSQKVIDVCVNTVELYTQRHQ